MREYLNCIDFIKFNPHVDVKLDKIDAIEILTTNRLGERPDILITNAQFILSNSLLQLLD